MHRRTHAEIRKLILTRFSKRALPIRQIALKARVDWYTAERHLNYLKGRELVREVFRHESLRLFVLTELGIKVSQYFKNKKGAEDVTKIIRKL